MLKNAFVMTLNQLTTTKGDTLRHVREMYVPKNVKLRNSLRKSAVISN